MSALHSIKKNLRRLGPDERIRLDMRIVSGIYHQSPREVNAALVRLEVARRRAKK